MIQGFDFKEQYIGTGAIADFEYSFFIDDPSQIRVYIQDPNGEIVEDTTADDSTVVSSVTFNDDNHGGTVSLANYLPTSYVMTLFLANDVPDQDAVFAGKFSLDLPAIEGSLDRLMAMLQRVAFLAQRAIRLHDLDNESAFDFRLPLAIAQYADRFLKLNAAGDGFDFGPTYTELTSTILAAQVAAEAAQTAAEAALADAEAAEALAASAAASATASAASAAASALAAAHSAASVGAGPWTVNVNNNLDLPGETTNSALFTQVDYSARIRRGTAVYARQEFTIFYRNSLWEIAISNDRYADLASDHGVTFTVNAVTGQINAAVANDGGSNATIDVIKTSWSA